jgi:hypothetical protein
MTAKKISERNFHKKKLSFGKLENNNRKLGVL